MYNLADDVSEKTDVASQHPDTVVALQKRVEVLAKEMAKPMFLVEALSTIKSRPSEPPALPNEETYFDQEP